MKIFKHLNGYDVQTNTGILTCSPDGYPYMFDEGGQLGSCGIDVNINTIPETVAANILKFVYWRIN